MKLSCSTFCPTPGKYNKTNYDNGIRNFIRKIKLEGYFKATELSNKNIENYYIKSSTNK